MKKGIVMGIKNKKAFVLTKDGSFESISLMKDQHVEIGSEIIIPVTKKYFSFGPKRKTMSFVAVAVVFLLLFNQFPFLNQSNLALAAYITVDINPSIEVGVNDHLKVVKVVPLNRDGKEIVKQFQDEYKNQSLTKFINQIVEFAKKDGYLTTNRDLLLTTTVINKDAKDSIEKNVAAIKMGVQGKGVSVQTLSGDEQTRKKANNLGVSTGKYLIYQKSQNSITIEDTKELSITQIYDKIEQKNKEHKKENNKENKTYYHSPIKHNVKKEIIEKQQVQPFQENIDKPSNNKNNVDKKKYPEDYISPIKKTSNTKVKVKIKVKKSTYKKESKTFSKKEQNKNLGEEKKEHKEK